MINMPNKLCLKDGVLKMQDGSDVQKYLISRPMKDAPEVVLLTREKAIQLAEDAYAYQMLRSVLDERFVIAA